MASRNDDALIFASATALSRLLQEGEVTSVEVTRQYLERIDRGSYHQRGEDVGGEVVGPVVAKRPVTSPDRGPDRIDDPRLGRHGRSSLVVCGG